MIYTFKAIHYYQLTYLKTFGVSALNYKKWAQGLDCEVALKKIKKALKLLILI